MEKPCKILLPIITAILFCMATYDFFHGMDCYIDQKSKTDCFETSSYHSQKLPLPNVFAIQAGSEFIFSNTSTSGSVKQLQIYKAAIDFNNKKLESSFFQYLEHIGKFPIRLRKSNTLFPFHNFF